MKETERQRAIRLTRQKRDYLKYRIEGKLKMEPPYDVVYDTEEMDAHTFLLREIGAE